MKKTGKIVVTACMAALVAIIAIAVTGYRTHISDDQITIVDSYVSDLGNKTFVLSDGWMVEALLTQQSVRYSNSLHEEYSNHWKLCGVHQNPHIWADAEVGMPVEKRVYHTGKLYSYVPILPKDTVAAYVVTDISKYNDSWDKMFGNIERFKDFLKRNSGNNEMLYEKMFLNIYFENRPPIMVNAAKNLLWLDIKPGCVVLAKTINGHTTFIPQL